MSGEVGYLPDAYVKWHASAAEAGCCPCELDFGVRPDLHDPTISLTAPTALRLSTERKRFEDYLAAREAAAAAAREATARAAAEAEAKAMAMAKAEAERQLAEAQVRLTWGGSDSHASPLAPCSLSRSL